MKTEQSTQQEVTSTEEKSQDKEVYSVMKSGKMMQMLKDEETGKTFLACLGIRLTEMEDEEVTSERMANITEQDMLLVRLAVVICKNTKTWENQ